MENKMDTLVNFYRGLIGVFGMAADEQGFVTIKGAKDPVFIDSCRLVLPTSYQLKDNPDSKRIIFHPLAEDINLGESKIIKFLKNQFNIRMNYAIAVLTGHMLSVIVDDKNHKYLTPEQRQLLTSVGEVNTKAADKWQAIMLSAIKEGSYANLYLNRGAVAVDPKTGTKRKHARGGTIAFPYYRKIENKEVTGMREMDRIPFMQVLKFVIPDMDVEGVYSAGSDSLRAPFLDALMKTALPIMVRVNELVDLYEKQIGEDDAQFTKFSMDWVEVMNDLENSIGLINCVPAQPDGPVKTLVKAEATGPSMAATVNVPKAPEYATPSVATLQAIANQPTSMGLSVATTKPSNGKSSMADVLGTQHQPQMMMHPQMQQMQPQMVMLPSGQMAMVQPQPQQMMQAPGMMQHNPLAQQHPQMMMHPAQMQQMQQAQQPVWATPSPEQVLVNTQRGIMNQAMATQLGLQYQIIQQPQQQMQPQMQMHNPMMQQPMGNGAPVWAR